LQAGGRRFDPGLVHQLIQGLTGNIQDCQLWLVHILVHNPLKNCANWFLHDRVERRSLCRRADMAVPFQQLAIELMRRISKPGTRPCVRRDVGWP